VHWTPDQYAIAAFQKGESGADLGVLERLADVVLSGGTVNPYLQRIANMILAEAILKGVLPDKKIGRKEADAYRGHEVAYMYLDLKDSRMRRKDAMAAVNDEFRVDERQIDRWVKQYTPMIGTCKEDRERFRTWRKVCEETGYQDYQATVRIDLNLRKHAPAVDVSPAPEQLLGEARRLLAGLRSEKILQTTI
jgi:hypothetical protein